MSTCLKKKIILTFCFLLFASFAQNANAAQTSLRMGVGGVFASSPYVGDDNLFLPFPVIHLEAKHVYIRGFSAGVFLWTDDNEVNELSIGLSLGELSFDNNDTDNARMSRLYDRKRAVDAYAQYIARTAYGHIGARISHDIAGNVDGFNFRAFYKIPVPLGIVTVTPGLGFNYDTEKRSDYYFGISHTESNRSGLSRYSPDGAISPFVSLDVNVRVNDKVSLFATGSANFLSSEIKDSPMVDEDKVYGATFGVMYTFK